MIPSAAAKGRSFKGAIAYIVHDPGQAKSDERVLFVETRNMLAFTPEKAARVMAWTALHAAELKALAGIKATGRKTENPVYHLSLSWIPGEKPTRQDMMAAGEAALNVLGYGEHEAIYAAHGDKAHPHLHIVVNRIHPVTGKTHNPKDDHKLLQKWGHDYDKARGMEHHTPERAARHEKDTKLRAEYKKQAEASREKTGAANDNTSTRPSWNAAKGATHPKSRRYLEITAEYGGRAKALAAESREFYKRQRQARSDLAERHRQERAALTRPGAAAGKLSPVFQGAARASQRTELRKAQAAQRAEGRKSDRQDNETKAQLRQTLHAVTHTPVGMQGTEHRGHLSARFNHAAERAGPGDSLTALKGRPRTELRGLRGPLSRPGPVAPVKSQQRQRAALFSQQRHERQDLRMQQRSEHRELQGKWSALNTERAQAWDAYRAQRAEQASARTPEKTTPRDIFADRQITGRDYARPSEGASRGTGREIARKGPS